MASVEASIFIAALPEEVFDYVQDPANLASHQGIVLHAKTQSGAPIRNGCHFTGTSEVMGRTYEWKAEIIDHERPHIVSFRVEVGKIRITISYRMRAEGPGTRLTYWAEALPCSGKSFGLVAEALAVESYRRQVSADLQTLNRILAGSSR